MAETELIARSTFRIPHFAFHIWLPGVGGRRTTCSGTSFGDPAVGGVPASVVEPTFPAPHDDGRGGSRTLKPFRATDFKSVVFTSFTTRPKTRHVEVEARIGIEPMCRGFADLRLTTWLPRRAMKDEETASIAWASCLSRGGTTDLGLKIDLPADAQDVDAIRMVAGFILNERLGRAAGGGETAMVLVVAASGSGGNRAGGGGALEDFQVVDVLVIERVQRVGIPLAVIIPVRRDGVVDLLQVVLTLGSPRLLAHLHRPGREEPDQDPDDGDDNEEFDERKTRRLEKATGPTKNSWEECLPFHAVAFAAFLSHLKPSSPS